MPLLCDEVRHVEQKNNWTCLSPDFFFYLNLLNRAVREGLRQVCCMNKDKGGKGHLLCNFHLILRLAVAPTKHAVEYEANR